ncbi:ferritin family protein [Omnitrophica bacterium]|nr:ferritin family protein [Candidatus Omnitrophota bacterium]
MSDDKGLTEALNASIEMEEEGRAFYIKAAKNSKNEFGKRVFEALADDEIRHIAAIKQYYEAIAKKKKAPQLGKVMPRHKNIKERLIFGKRESELLKKIPAEADELKAYEIAANMENEGYRFYKKTLDEAGDPDVKDLYKFLISEEEVHLELVSNAYEYLRDPAAWFAKEERPIVEG